jgi:hypothetical protein
MAPDYERRLVSGQVLREPLSRIERALTDVHS